MCGINGYAGGWAEGLVGAMDSSIVHRGPDGEGVFEDPDACIALGHVRLAILDLSPLAAQPMCSKCGRYVLTYNGGRYLNLVHRSN